MEKVDLEKDPEKLAEYQADKAYKQLGVIQLHFEDILGGNSAFYCLGCSFKHFQNLTTLCQECVGGACPSQPIWQEMAKWAEQEKEKVLELIKERKLPKDEEARKIAEKARDYRKEMEKILFGEVLPEIKEDTREHIS